MPRESYFQILENKTAILLAAACSAPAILAGRPQVECDTLARFGHNVGFAFQLLDDALDYAGSEQIFGKKTLADLPEGKVTLPVMLLREKMTPEEWAPIAKIIRKVEISAADMSFILDRINLYDTAGETLMLAEEYTQQALLALEVFPESKERRSLTKLTRSLLLRSN